MDGFEFLITCGFLLGVYVNRAAIAAEMKKLEGHVFGNNPISDFWGQLNDRSRSMNMPPTGQWVWHEPPCPGYMASEVWKVKNPGKWVWIENYVLNKQ